VKEEERLEKFDGSEHAVSMQNNTSEPMEPSEQFGPNPTCWARGQKGEGNIIIPDRKRQRYRCKIGETISESDLTGGQFGVFVTGPDASFRVTSVVLTT
jgi:hypothetical protein